MDLNITQAGAHDVEVRAGDRLVGAVRRIDGEVFAIMTLFAPLIAAGNSTIYRGTDATAALGVLVSALLLQESIDRHKAAS